MRCTVALATMSDGRSLSRLKLMLLGVKPSEAGEMPGISGGGTSAAGNMPYVPSTRSSSMRPASSVRQVSVRRSVLKK